MMFPTQSYTFDDSVLVHLIWQMGGWCIVAKCCWYLLAIQGSAMGMRVMLFTGVMLCYVITLITNPYMIYAKDNKMGSWSKQKEKLCISSRAMEK